MLTKSHATAIGQGEVVPSPKVLLMPAEDITTTAVAIWLTKYCTSSRDPEGDQGLVELLPSFYSHASPDSPLAHAVRAQALTIVGRWPERVEWKRLSLSEYAKAVVLINKALESASGCQQDDVLVAVFTLFFYERVNLPFVPGAALLHIKGAASLIKARGAASFNTYESQQLLWLARTHVANVYMSPMEDAGLDEALWIDPPKGIYQNTATRLISAIAAVSTVRRLVSRSIKIGDTDKTLALEIVSTARMVDETLVQWSRSVPADWKQRTPDTLTRSIREAGMYRDLCACYSSLWAANAWSRYRAIRIALQTLILQYAWRTHAPTHDLVDIVQAARTILTTECNGICASVPFYLGSRNTNVSVDEALIEFPQCSSFDMSKEMRQQLIMFGEWYLFWPLSRMVQNLELLSKLGILCISQEQFEWACAQTVRCGHRAKIRSPLSRRDNASG